MAVQPQQPIFPDQLNLALDRLFARVTTYISGQTDAIMTQMRIDKQESLARDEALRQESLARDLELKASIQTLSEAILSLTQETHSLTQRMDDLTQEVREGFAAQAERHNELMVQVERLERRFNPPEETP